MSDGGPEGASGGDVDNQAASVCKPLGMTSPYKLEKAFACNAGDTPRTLGVVSYIHDYMQCKLNRTSQNIFERIAAKPWYRPTLAAAATLAIALYSTTILVGIHRFTPYDIIANLMRIGAVFFLATSWGNFTNYIKNFFEGAVNSLSAGLAGALAEGLTGVQFMDQIISDIVSYNTLKIILALVGTGGNGWGYALLMIVLVVSYMWGLLTAIYIVLISLVGRHLLYALAPMFLVFLMFESTRDMFNGWVKQLVGFTLKPVMIFAVLGFLKAMYDYFMGRLITTTTNICYKQLWPMPGDIIQLNWWQFGTDAVTIEGPKAQVPFSFAGFFVLIMIGWIMRYMFTWADKMGTELAQVTSKNTGALIGWATARTAMGGVAGVALGGVGGAVFGKGGQGGIIARLSGNSGATGGLWNVNNLKVLRNAIRGNPIEVAGKVLTAPLSIAGNVLYGAAGNMAAKAGEGVKGTMRTAAKDVFGVDTETMKRMDSMTKAMKTPSPQTERKTKVADVAAKQVGEKVALRKKVDDAFDKLRTDTNARKAGAAAAGLKKAGQQMDKQAKLVMAGMSGVKATSAQRAQITQLLQRQQQKLQALAEGTDVEMQKFSKQREGDLRKGIGQLQEAQDKKLEELLAGHQKKREELSKQQQERRKISSLSKPELAKKEAEEFQKLNDELKVSRARFDEESKKEEENLRSAHSTTTAEGIAAIVAKQNIQKKQVTKEFDKELDKVVAQMESDAPPQNDTTQERPAVALQSMRDEAEREEKKDEAKQDQDIQSNVFDADRRVVEVAKQEHQLKKEQKDAQKKELLAAGATPKEVEALMKKSEEEASKKMGETRKSNTGNEKATSSWMFGDSEGKPKEEVKKPSTRDEAPTPFEQPVDHLQQQRDEEARQKEREARVQAEEARRKKKKQEEEDEELRQALEEARKAEEAAKKNKPGS